MLDEEKEAIEELKNKKADYFMISDLTGKTLLNLIEKQSKEIELLKEENEKYKNPPFFDEDKYTEKDKIKAKIEEVKDGAYDAKIVLQSLLEKE